MMFFWTIFCLFCSYLYCSVCLIFIFYYWLFLHFIFWFLWIVIFVLFYFGCFSVGMDFLFRFRGVVCFFIRSKILEFYFYDIGVIFFVFVLSHWFSLAVFLDGFYFPAVGFDRGESLVDTMVHAGMFFRHFFVSKWIPLL